MTSIYRRALGDAFEDLHPEIRERFGVASDDGVACIGRGEMAHVRNGGLLMYPFLRIGATMNTMFPETGTDVPFEVRNYAYVDAYGRETVTWLREFRLPGGTTRRFDAAMIYSEDRDCIVDYLGSHHHLAVDVDLSVSDRGGMRLRTGDQRLYLRDHGVPFPMVLSARADVHEWYDDGAEQFRIAVEVTNAVFGTVFEYAGSFQVEWIDCESAPEAVRPVSPTRGE